MAGVRKALDKIVEEWYALSCTFGLGVVCNEDIGEFVPQLALPEILELDDEVLKLVRGLIPLVSEEVGDGVDVHGPFCILSIVELLNRM